MSYKKMPPQAYTKETLQEAFEWWSRQSEEFRNKIQDKDDLVGYYLRVQRAASPEEIESLKKEAKESFSSELRGLAENLSAFEGYKKKEYRSESVSHPGSEEEVYQQSFPLDEAQRQDTPLASQNQKKKVSYRSMGVGSAIAKKSSNKTVFKPSFQLQFPEMAQPLTVEGSLEEGGAEKRASSGFPPTKPKAGRIVSRVKAGPPVKSSKTSSTKKIFHLDERSMQVILKAKEALNLSSEEEALRAVISLGSSKIKCLL